MKYTSRIVVLITSLVLFAPAALVAQDVSISEIRIDQSGTNSDEYVELVGPPGQSLDNISYIVIGDYDSTPGSGAIEYVLTFNRSRSIPSDGYFVAAESTFTLGTADLTRKLNFENSDNVTHMLVSDFSGKAGDDLDTNDDGILDATPWAIVLDRIAIIEEDNPPSGTEYHYGPPTVGPDGPSSPGHVFKCDGKWEIGHFDIINGIDTPGGPNWCLLRRGAIELGDGWRWLNWFGYFNLSNDPWTFHMEHGWLYPFGTTTESIVFWDNDMDTFWWTSDTQYPYVYRFSDGEWLWYQKGTSGPRWFVRLSDGAWEEW